MFDQAAIDRCKEALEETRKTVKDGPWNHEGDRHQFKVKGYDCLITRNTMLVWCGYVGLKPDHPWYGKPYNDIDCDAYGGLTYGEHCNGVVCHKTDGDDDLYWIGFDCAHSFDFIPGLYAKKKDPSGLGRSLAELDKNSPFGKPTYKTKDSVISQVEHMVDAVIEEKRYKDQVDEIKKSEKECVKAFIAGRRAGR